MVNAIAAAIIAHGEGKSERAALAAYNRAALSLYGTRMSARDWHDIWQRIDPRERKP